MLGALLITSSILSLQFVFTRGDCTGVCSRGSSTCSETADISAGKSQVVSKQCSQGSSLVVDIAEFAQDDSTGGNFTVTFFDRDNYQRFINGSSYNYSSTVGTGDVNQGAFGCYGYKNATARFPLGGVAFVVIQCVDEVNPCRLSYVITFRCETSDPCNGIECTGHSVCVNGSCECDIGYADNDCMLYDPCVNVDCNFRGSCRDGRCYCFTGYTGSNCSQTSPDCTTDCSGNGYCSAGRCICEPTYIGDDCSVMVSITRSRNTDDGGLSTTSIVVIVVCLVVGSIVAVVFVVAGSRFIKRSRERDRSGLVASHSDPNILSRGSTIIEDNPFGSL